MRLKKGLLGETIDNCIQLHDEDSFPIIEVYQRVDAFGNVIDDDNIAEKMADKICGIEF